MLRNLLNRVVEIVTSEMPETNKKNRRKARTGLWTRSLHLESLENRELLSVQAWEFEQIRNLYADLHLSANMADYNVIEIEAANLSAASLQAAINEAAGTTKQDLIVVRTTALQNTITYASAADGINVININVATRGSVTIVSLGVSPLTIDAAQKTRGLYITNTSGSGTVAIANLTIKGGYGGYGGGICSDGSLTVTNCTISGNTTIYGGGGIYNGGTLTVTNSTISGNTATTYGGGIYSYGTDGKSTLTVTNSKIIENTAAYNGGGIYNSSSSNYVTITNSTICGNTGGGICSIDGTTSLYNAIIALNIGGDIYQYSGTVQGFNNLTSYTGWNGTSGSNFVYNASLPLFVDAANGNYRLAINSQAINKGDNARAVYLDGSPILLDLAKNARITGGTVDIGAYEYFVAPALNTPENFRVTTQGKTALTLSWNKVEGATGYVLERQNSNGTWTVVSSGANTYGTDSSLTANTEYTYRVKATGASGALSAYSGGIVATTLAADKADVPAITESKLDPTDPKKATLSWANLGAGCTYYVFSNGVLLTTGGTTETTYIDNRSNMPTRTFFVYAYDSVAGDWSNTPAVVLSTGSVPEFSGHSIGDDNRVTLNWDIPGATSVVIFSDKGVALSTATTLNGAGSWTDNTSALAANGSKGYVIYAYVGDDWIVSSAYVVTKPTPAQTGFAAGMMMFAEESQTSVSAPQSLPTSLATLPEHLATPLSSSVTMDAVFALDVAEEASLSGRLGDSAESSDDWFISGRRSATVVMPKPHAADEFWKLYGVDSDKPLATALRR